jgi:DNA polymerase
MPHTLAIDIETYSSLPLNKVGVYKYVEAPDFEIILVALKLNNTPTRVYDLTGGPNSSDYITVENIILPLLTDPEYVKTAFNAQFELTCLQKFFGVTLDASQWRCTMVLAGYLGMPMNLDKVGAVLNLPVQKDKQGKALLRTFTVPRKPTKHNSSIRTRPGDAPEKWAAFMRYNATDVEAEVGVRKKIEPLVRITDFESKLWALDQKINARGILVDVPFVRNAIQIDNYYRAALLDEAKQITGLENPNSVPQLLKWLNENGIEASSLNKEVLPGLLANAEGDTARVLEIRQQLSKTSVKKYAALHSMRSNGNRARGMLQFNGAGRTARWAGRGVQVHNLPKTYGEVINLDIARSAINSGQMDVVDMLYGNVSFILKQCIRTALIASPGKVLLATDFSAIEARVISWFAWEQWKLEVFAANGPIYSEAASRMFLIPVDQCGKGTTYRERGKIAELALGFQGGAGAIARMNETADPLEEYTGVKKERIPAEEYEGIVKKWRKANSRIAALWREVENAAVEAVASGTSVTAVRGLLKFFYVNGCLYIKLPSGRCLHYYDAKLKEGKYGEQVTYMGISDVNKKWVRLNTYGGKLVENIVQATARDLLAYKMHLIDTLGYDIVLHVHDEIVLEVDEATAQDELDAVNEVMALPVSWAKGLLLKGDSFITKYYKKD